MPAPLLDIRNLQLELSSDSGSVRVVDDLSLTVMPGETVCLVGESGSGKSVTALSIARLLASPPARYPAGEIRLEGVDTLQAGPPELRAVRGRVVSYVFQDPAASLNPVFRIGRQIKETLKLHRPEHATDAEVVRWLRLVGLPAAKASDYPFQLSGGMQQRAMLALALASHPRLLVADEPTAALDVTLQAQILELLVQLKQQLGMAVLLITHNLAMVAGIADRLAVMYAGQLVEIAPAGELLRRPLHPYTHALLTCVHQLGRSNGPLQSIPGSVPDAGDWPQGCRFAPRCAIARPECSQAMPPLVEVAPGRHVRCPFWASQVDHR